MVAQRTGSVHANGEFSIGIAPRKLNADSVRISTARYSPEEEWRAAALDMFGAEAVTEMFPAEPPIGSSSVPISEIRSPKGQNGISGNGRRNLRIGCHLLEQHRDRHKIGFATLTLPELTLPDRVAVHLAWGDLVNQFIKFMRRRLKEAGAPQEICYVTEIQTKRLNRDGRAYYHLHFCYPCTRVFDYQWYVPAHEMRVAWKRLVSSVCSSSYDFDASVDCVVVKKSVGAYLGKYLSKGGGNVAQARANGLPVDAIGHWWGWTAPLRKRARRLAIRSNGLVEWLWASLPRLVEIGAVRWLRYIYIDTNLSGPRCVGVCGCLDIRFYDELYRIYRNSGRTIP